ncbi:hypothetical protein FRUB_07047 [Fimbriiglobus ruber]|uniref:Uncharacterized protein n=1 Tax=Fimbriiglobus ruber TaxID=1908690 RepID=A0A225DP37_9BACT|nr:hypothetical protein FRUB_07047 [Fimbriiglobus ruber]
MAAKRHKKREDVSNYESTDGRWRRGFSRSENPPAEAATPTPSPTCPTLPDNNSQTLSLRRVLVNSGQRSGRGTSGSRPGSGGRCPSPGSGGRRPRTGGRIAIRRVRGRVSRCRRGRRRVLWVERLIAAESGLVGFGCAGAAPEGILEFVHHSAAGAGRQGGPQPGQRDPSLRTIHRRPASHRVPSMFPPEPRA